MLRLEIHKYFVFFLYFNLSISRIHHISLENLKQKNFKENFKKNKLENRLTLLVIFGVIFLFFSLVKN